MKNQRSAESVNAASQKYASAKNSSTNPVQEFGQVYVHFASKIQAEIGRKYPGIDKDDIFDIVQDSFVTLWKYIQAGNANYCRMEAAEMKAVCKRIAYCQASKFVEKCAPAVHYEDALEYDMEDCDDSSHMLLERMEEAIKHLSKSEQKLMICILEGKKPDEICNVLGLKDAKVVKQSKYRAIAHLKDLIKDEGYE